MPKTTAKYYWKQKKEGSFQSLSKVYASAINCNTFMSFPHSWLIAGLASTVSWRVPLVQQELLALPGAPEINLGLHELHIAQFIVFCRSLFVFFLLSIVFSVFNLCLLITTLVCQIFLMIISTHFNNMFSKWFLYVFAHLKPNDFIPIHSCRGHMDDEHMKFLYSFFLWEVQHFYLTCKHVTLSNHEALIYTGTNTWGWVVYLIYPANPLDK
jgi:hypothetical protein